MSESAANVPHESGEGCLDCPHPDYCAGMGKCEIGAAKLAARSAACPRCDDTVIAWDDPQNPCDCPCHDGQNDLDALHQHADKLIERYERLLADNHWPDSQEKARRAVRTLVNELKKERKGMKC